MLNILSGGQTGVDRAALDGAIQHGISHGGYCPRLRWAEDGPISNHYQLIELESDDPTDRTKANVEASDAVLIIHGGELDEGTRLTMVLAKEHTKPCLEIDCSRLDIDKAAELMEDFMSKFRYINVAGPRESFWPMAYSATRRILHKLFSNMSGNQ